jgi:predicted transcriptional regulator
MNGRQLRDLKRNTELLILVEVLESPTARLKDIADKLEVTVQAVSQYMSAMRKEGLVREHRGTLRPTQKGMQLLQEHFTGIKGEVDTILRRISVIDRCVAIAGDSIKKGARIGLIMEDGMLMAFPGRRSPSTGEALEDAEEGDDLLVGKLEGIVDLELGELLIIEAPSEMEGGSKAANVERVRGRLDDFSPGLIVAGDAVGAALLMKASGELFTIHAPIHSSMSALSKGVDVAFSGTRDSIDQLLEAVEDLKRSSGYEIKRKVFKG